MIASKKEVVWDGAAYGRNRDAVDPESLRECLGQILAWSLDGTKLLAHHEDPKEVVRQIRSMGLDTDQVVMERLLTLYADD